MKYLIIAMLALAPLAVTSPAQAADCTAFVGSCTDDGACTGFVGSCSDTAQCLGYVGGCSGDGDCTVFVGYCGDGDSCDVFVGSCGCSDLEDAPASHHLPEVKEPVIPSCVRLAIEATGDALDAVAESGEVGIA